MPWPQSVHLKFIVAVSEDSGMVCKKEEVDKARSCLLSGWMLWFGSKIEIKTPLRTVVQTSSFL